MKNSLSNPKLLILITLLLFLTLNGAYFWQVWPLRWLISMALLLLFFFIWVFFAFFFQLLNGIKGKFQSRSRLALLIFMGLVLALTVYQPRGIIDFERLEGETLFIASRNGVAGCSTTFKLRSNQRYSYHSVCFGYEHTRGRYRVQEDTILLMDPIPIRESGAYTFAIIRPHQQNDSQFSASLALYTSKNDSLPQILWISKNILPH